MADALFLLIVIGFFALMALLVRACDHIIGPDGPSPDSPESTGSTDSTGSSEAGSGTEDAPEAGAVVVR